MAVRAADAVIAEPGHRYNPLFLAGPSGVGKTHLLNAIGNELARRGGANYRVACVGAQLFIDELIAALQDGTIERLRARYRAADALLLDDVQFVGGKERTQDELFHVFNHFHAAGKQLVFASDVPPKQIEGLEERLRSRFEGGLVAELSAPDRTLREKLFAPLPRRRERAGRRRSSLSYLAERSAASVRELIGTVHRLVAAAESAGAPLTLPIARADARAGDWRRDGAAADACGRPPTPSSSTTRRSSGTGPTSPAARRGAALMAIKGSLKEASLPDVLQLLAMGKKTGCLAVTHRNNFGYIYFDKGQHLLRVDRQPARPPRRHPRQGGLGHAGAARGGDQRAGAAPRQAHRRAARRAGRDHARRAAPADPPPDRGGGVLPVHLDAGDVQLRGGRAPRGAGLPRVDQPRVAAARGRAARGRVEADREEDPGVRPRVRRRPQEARRERGRS